MNATESMTERLETPFPIFCKDKIGIYCITSNDEAFEVMEHLTEQAIIHSKTLRGANNSKYNGFLVGEMYPATQEEFTIAIKVKTKLITDLHMHKLNASIEGVTTAKQD